MSTTQGTHNLTSDTKADFNDFLWNTLLPHLSNQELPDKKQYSLQGLKNDMGRVNVHNKALNDTPLSPGDQLTQYYIQELGMVIIDLNPDAEG